MSVNRARYCAPNLPHPEGAIHCSVKHLSKRCASCVGSNYRHNSTVVYPFDLPMARTARRALPYTPLSQFHPHDDNAVSVLAYSVETVKVEHVIVVGHTDCGGVKACHAATKRPPPFPRTTALQRWLAPLTELVWALGSIVGQCHDELTPLVEANVRMQVANVLSSDVLAREWKRRDVCVHGWVYEIETGRLRDLEVSAGRDGPLQC